MSAKTNFLLFEFEMQIALVLAQVCSAARCVIADLLLGCYLFCNANS
jgi:hypothetical protein